MGTCRLCKRQFKAEARDGLQNYLCSECVNQIVEAGSSNGWNEMGAIVLKLVGRIEKLEIEVKDLQSRR